MNTETKSHYCPSKEELSNWYDNGGDESIKNHLQECVPCEESVGFYRKVDETVCSSSVAPDYLAADIAEACRHLEHETLVFPFWVRLARVAAVIAVVGSVATALHIMTSPGEDAHGGRIVTVGESPGNVSPGVTVSANEPSGQQEPETIGSLHTVSTADIRPVSVNANRDSGSGDALIQLGDSVRHVWAVDNIKAASTSLLEALPNDVSKHCFSNLSRETLTFQAAMSDVELQSFVNTLQARGWALVSKDFPQPGEIKKLSLNGHRVNYQIDLVKKVD